MKKIILPALTVLICALIIAVVPTEAEAAIYDDTVRLHIIANSDGEEDQRLKLLLRDAVLERYGQSLCAAKSKEDAEARFGNLLSDIEEYCEKTVRGLGYSYPVKATLTEEYYETRKYEEFTLPAGEYTSLRLVIGSGAGKNWWCVMYPPLCLGASVADDGIMNYSDGEKRLIRGGEYKVKFKLLELISQF